MRKAVIVGAGIGGLATGIALRRAGWQVEVLERAPSLDAVGAGLALWANALHALDLLAVGEQIRKAGVPNTDGWLYDWRGAKLSPLTTPALRARFGEIGIVVHRADLQRVLLDALGADAVATGAEVVTVEERDDGIEARLRDGRGVRGDLLVGADGLGSVVRTALHGSTPPRYAGYTAWRAVLPFDPARLEPGESWGRGTRFGRAPLAGGRAYVFATANTPAGARGPQGEKAELLRRFSDWHAPIPEIVASLDESTILRNDIFDRAPLEQWGRGRITLLGDAAHPMTPNLGQGACQALEDAVVLGRCLGSLGRDPDAGGIGTALRAYEAARIPRTSALVRQSRQVGAVGQWSNPLAMRVRTLMARHLVPRMQVRQYEELFAFEG